MKWNKNTCCNRLQHQLVELHPWLTPFSFLGDSLSLKLQFMSVHPICRKSFVTLCISTWLEFPRSRNFHRNFLQSFIYSFLHVLCKVVWINLILVGTALQEWTQLYRVAKVRYDLTVFSGELVQTFGIKSLRSSATPPSTLAILKLVVKKIKNKRFRNQLPNWVCKLPQTIHRPYPATPTLSATFWI